jgi:hypothetical protein
MTDTKVTTAMAGGVSDELLVEFDRLAGQGDTMPLAEIKQRYAASSYFASYRDSEIYTTLLELPITVDMLASERSFLAVSRIITALKEIHGDQLLIDLDNRGTQPELRVRMWRPEKDLRRMWKAFAEAEYKTKLAVAS